MQTLRKRNSPCKYKNEPARFLGDGMTFKAKLIGILEVNEARGDKMCQDALNDLKTAIRAAGEHKQRITISIAIDGLRLRDEKTGDSMYHHPVHKISFIAQDMSDSRAFGYIFGSPDTGHRFFGIKTDKTASQVVIAMRDLFQVVFELKKKEIEMTKRHIELHQNQFGGDSSTKDDSDKGKAKSTDHNKTHSENQSNRELAAAVAVAVKETASSARNPEAIADLLDLEDELNNIQQGISQMDRITPSDPFGPLSSKCDSFLDSFKEKTSEITKPSTLSRRSVSQGSNKEHSDSERSASASSRAVFFPSAIKPPEEQHWFDQETDSLFSDAPSHPPDTSVSPVTFHTPTGETEPTFEEKKSPMKTDLFTDLDPLGTGKVKPYLDKKDFFQELKNPPKKVLKELISTPSKPETTHYFAADFKNHKKESSPSVASIFEPSVIQNSLSNAPKDSSHYAKIDPFEDMDPFEKADPFLEDSFPKSIGFPSLISAKASVDVLHERAAFHQERFTQSISPEERANSPKHSIFSSSSIHGPLRVSLPPEKADTNTTISLSSLASRFRSSPSPTEDSKAPRRKHYQALKQSHEDKSDDQSNSPILEEVYVRGSPKPFNVNNFDKRILIGSPPPARSEKVRAKMSASLELLDSTPDPPPRPKTTLFAIKPPPLPPKKQNQPIFRPPARPPSLEDNVHYDYLRQKTESNLKTENTVKVSSPKKNASGGEALKRQSSLENFTNFPILPRPPQRKQSVESGRDSVTTPTSVKASSPEKKETSVLNITLNQLDKAGFESLATTLGIPTENVCNMTLQELTKVLAHKYLGVEDEKTENSSTDPAAFHADFDSNFSDLGCQEMDTGYDKYAVFKELIADREDTNISKDPKTEETFSEFPITFNANKLILKDEVSKEEEEEEEGEDKYAALRQLSIGQKSDNLSEDLDISNEDDSSAVADGFIIKPVDESIIPLSSDIVNESPIIDEEYEEKEEEVKEVVEEVVHDWNETQVTEPLNKIEEPVDKYSIIQEKTIAAFESSGNDNWATFEKEEGNLADDKANDNANSPLSSDGKDETKGKVTWHKPRFRGDFPWKDEDESCDDFSAKESYWSDESSHDGQSPVKENISSSYHRKAWNRHVRPPKGPLAWPESPHWHRRWLEDTEDEYDDMRRRRRPPPSSFDRKKDVDYESRDRLFSRGWGAWEGDRYPRGYATERRKPRGEFRRGCDSDASDKEYMNIEREYPEPLGAKQKQYYGHTSREALDRHWSDSRESRSKHKRSTGHKRPSSASDAKRYEKIYSPIDHPQRSPEKRESEEEEYPPRFRPSRKDMRYHSNIEHYGSYDRRVQASHQRRMQRGKRLKDIEPMETRHFLGPETPHSAMSEDTPEPSKELHFKFEDDFISSPNEPGRTLPSESPSDKRQQDREWSVKSQKKHSPLPTDNNNGHFASFDDDFPTSPQVKEKQKVDGGGVIKKPSLKGRGQMAILGRQDSSKSLRKSESINIFSRESDPFEDDDFFSSGNNAGEAKLSRFFAEKSKSNSNVSDPFAWKQMFGDCKFED